MKIPESAYTYKKDINKMKKREKYIANKEFIEKQKWLNTISIDERQEEVNNRKFFYEIESELERRIRKNIINNKNKQKEDLRSLNSWGLRRYTASVCDNIIKKFIDSNSKLSTVTLTDMNYKDHNLYRHIRRRINDLELDGVVKIYKLNGEIYLKRKGENKNG